MHEPFINLAAYHFTPIPEADLPGLRKEIWQACAARNLKGTVLLSPEGINIFLAGLATEAHNFLDFLCERLGLANLESKRSPSSHQPFRRLLVRIKKEIIAFGLDDIAPANYTSQKLLPQELKAWLDEGRDLVLLDTRNDYEVRLGTFRGATTLGIRTFRDFPAAVGTMPEDMKSKPIVMFCTGGIRCEKAGPFMEKVGFQKIYQLEGGILNYFATCGRAHYDGECFVFDRRVAVDSHLQESTTKQCFRCLSPLTAADQTDPRFVENESCPHCFQSAQEHMLRLLRKRHERLADFTKELPGSQPYDHLLPVNIPKACDRMRLDEALQVIYRGHNADDLSQDFCAGRWITDEGEVVYPERFVRSGERYLRRTPQMIEPPVAAAIRILYEDRALIVVQKPSPLPMHPGGRFQRNTLQYMLQIAYAPFYPRPVHRLDANTSGLVLFGLHRRATAQAQKILASGNVEKIYLARVHGHPTKREFSCDAAISSSPGKCGSRDITANEDPLGLPARTTFQVIETFADGTSLLQVTPLSGRTNQIRLHLAHLGFPICGDTVYAAGPSMAETQTLRPEDPPLCLHAWKLKFPHPETLEPLAFEAEIPSWTKGEVTSSIRMGKRTEFDFAEHFVA